MPSARLLFGLIIALVVQFGLAILGWGGFVPFFSHEAFVGLLIVTIWLSIASFFTRGNLSPGEREDRGNRWMFIAFAAIALLSSFVPAYTDRIGFWTLDGDGLRWLGYGRRRTAHLAGLRARHKIQRPCRHPARA
jgi:hypothetical protein